VRKKPLKITTYGEINSKFREQAITLGNNQAKKFREQSYNLV